MSKRTKNLRGSVRLASFANYRSFALRYELMSSKLFSPDEWKGIVEALGLSPREAEIAALVLIEIGDQASYGPHAFAKDVSLVGG